MNLNFGQNFETVQDFETSYMMNWNVMFCDHSQLKSYINAHSKTVNHGVLQM